MRMNTFIFLTLQSVPVLAAGSLSQGASKAMGIVMLIGFIFGTICVIGGLIIAGAPVIVKALFTAFGVDSSTVDVGAFQ